MTPAGLSICIEVVPRWSWFPREAEARLQAPHHIYWTIGDYPPTTDVRYLTGGHFLVSSGWVAVSQPLNSASAVAAYTCRKHPICHPQASHGHLLLPPTY